MEKRSQREWERLTEQSKLRSMERRLAAHERRVKRKLWWSLALAILALIIVSTGILLFIWFVQ
jgi:hypothetical protein